jgi:hypothetical protein
MLDLEFMDRLGCYAWIIDFQPQHFEQPLMLKEDKSEINEFDAKNP